MFQTDLVEILGVRPHDKVEEPIQEAEIIEDSVSHTLAEPKQEESTEIDI